MFVADAITEAPPLAHVPEPLVFSPLLSAAAGLLLDALGGRLRKRLEAGPTATG